MSLIRLCEQDSTASNLVSPDSLDIQPSAKKQIEDTAMSFLLGRETDRESTPTWEVEIERFQVHHDLDALDWWRNNEMRFPSLAKLARCCLCVPATSVSSERIFLIAGLVISNKRSNLTPKNVDMLIFLSKNCNVLMSEFSQLLNYSTDIRMHFC